MSKPLGYISAFFLSALLLLLTIGLPVTYNSVKEITQDITKSGQGDNNPYSNTNEEKTPSNLLSINEEYVHEIHHDLHMPLQQISIAYIHAHEAVYKAYHGELHCPPPNNLA